MYDVAIIGAGPAGSTLARLLPPEHRVLLVDRRPLDAPPHTTSRRKPCGGLLAPAAQYELARQGLGVPPTVLDGPALFAVRTLDAEVGLERLYQRFYVNIDRERFDRWLVSLVPPQTERRFGWSLKSLEPDDGISFLTFETAEGTRVGACARVVVGADGAASTVRRLAFPGTPHPARYVAVQTEHLTEGGDAHFGALFDPRITDFYGWTVPKGGRCLAGIAVPAGQRSRVADAHTQLVQRAREAGFGLGDEVARISAPLLRPSGPSQLCTGRDGVLLLGEAAGFISPSSAEGISYALRSGASLASALVPGLAGAAIRYRSAVLPLAVSVCVKQAKSAAIYSPSVRHALMRSGITSVAEGERLVTLRHAIS